MDPTWNFLRLSAMMMPADHMANPLQHTDLTETELLMREAIQNSVDEHRPGAEDPVRFTVRRSRYRGDEKRALVKAFKLHEISDRVSGFSSEMDWLKRKETCLAHLDDPDIELPVLMLSDHNTNGLSGTWNKRGRDNRFHNLALSIYGSYKAENVDLLGSYGLGKMVYAVASRIRTMAYYSTFAPTDASDGVVARFMSTAFLPSHSHGGEDYSGHAFFGEPSGSTDFPAAPMSDGVAHAFAERVGLDVRSDADTGLTVMLLDCGISPEECLDACEKYWWPRNLDGDPGSYIELEFFDGDERLRAFDPRGRREIKPFIDCYSNAIQGVRPEGYDCAPIKLGGKVLAGTLCLREMVDGETSPDGLTNSVALIRSGLVIQYRKDYAREGDPDALGVFVAGSSEIKKAYMLSEPEAHDEWNQNNMRLKRAMGEEAVRWVKRSHERIKERFRDFQTRLKDTPPKRTSDGLKFLDDLLGPLFKKPRTGPPPPPPSRERAFRITKKGWRDTDNDPVQDRLDFTVSLRDDLGVASATCDVKAVLRVLETADAGVGSAVPCKIIDTNGNVVVSGGDTFEIEISSGETMKFHATAHVHPAWRTKWVVSVAGQPPR